MKKTSLSFFSANSNSTSLLDFFNKFLFSPRASRSISLKVVVVVLLLVVVVVDVFSVVTFCKKNWQITVDKVRTDGAYSTSTTVICTVVISTIVRQYLQYLSSVLSVPY